MRTTNILLEDVARAARVTAGLAAATALGVLGAGLVAGLAPALAALLSAAVLPVAALSGGFGMAVRLAAGGSDRRRGRVAPAPSPPELRIPQPR
jgi:hypothetical protein